MTELLTAPPTAEDAQAENSSADAHEGIGFGNIGLDGIRAVLEDKARREREFRAEPAPSPEDRARTAISSLEDPRAQQALLGELDDVTRVMKVVDTLRASAPKEQPVTDRKIYLTYRGLAEAENSNPLYGKTCQILLNLMGDNVSGKLPF
jgi:hypothetical protein